MVAFVHDFCYICGVCFAFDPRKVPYSFVDNERRPLCMDCVEMINDRRECVHGGGQKIEVEEGTYA